MSSFIHRASMNHELRNYCQLSTVLKANVSLFIFVVSKVATLK